MHWNWQLQAWAVQRLHCVRKGILIARQCGFRVGFTDDVGRSTGLSVLSGGQAVLHGCDAMQDLARGFMVSGSGTKLVAHTCRVRGTTQHANFARGAVVNLVDCKISGVSKCRTYVGGSGTVMSARGCDLSGNVCSNMSVAEGASAKMNACVLNKSKKGHGCQVDGVHSKLTAVRCSFSGNALSGVGVYQGSSAGLKGCKLNKNQIGVDVGTTVCQLCA